MSCCLFIIIICLNNKHIITWLLGNMEFMFVRMNLRSLRSLVSNILFNTRNKFHIFAQPCNILYILKALVKQI